jgi:tetrahydromethanopterin S-methyltransferase subunit D
MTFLLHSTILVTTLAATVAVALAGASIYDGFTNPVSAKSDRLPLFDDAALAYVTVETRGHGVSSLSSVPNGNDCHV